MKLSIIVPVYYNEETLAPLYEDIRIKLLNVIDFEYEIIFVDDGSKDNSWRVLQELQTLDENITLIRLSKNFGSHSAILCGLSNATGDCAIVKAADLQEPTEIIVEMINSWKDGNNVVLAVRAERDESLAQKASANFYYAMVKKFALNSMPRDGFDIFLIDKKVIEVLKCMNEGNSALTGQILWSGFQTGHVYYKRLARIAGKSKWTLKKKIRLVADTFFSFTTVPITLVGVIGFVSFIGAIIWAVVVFVLKQMEKIDISGWTSLFIFQLFSFGIIMLTLSLLGGYLWRTFDAARSRPIYIVEERINGRKRDE